MLGLGLARWSQRPEACNFLARSLSKNCALSQLLRQSSTMSDRPIGADAAPSSSDEFPQMSRAELYDIMYQMKAISLPRSFSFQNYFPPNTLHVCSFPSSLLSEQLLADEKPQQIRQILTDNPRLTRFLFQVSI